MLWIRSYFGKKNTIKDLPSILYMFVFITTDSRKCKGR